MKMRACARRAPACPPVHRDTCPGRRVHLVGAARLLAGATPARYRGVCSRTDTPSRRRSAAAARVYKPRRAPTAKAAAHRERGRKLPVAPGFRGRRRPRSALCRHPRCAPTNGHRGPGRRAMKPARRPAIRRAAGRSGRARNARHRCRSGSMSSWRCDRRAGVRELRDVRNAQVVYVVQVGVAIIGTVFVRSGLLFILTGRGSREQSRGRAPPALH